jgi:hypothetical protein
MSCTPTWVWYNLPVCVETGCFPVSGLGCCTGVCPTGTSCAPFQLVSFGVNPTAPSASLQLVGSTTIGSCTTYSFNLCFSGHATKGPASVILTGVCPTGSCCTGQASTLGFVSVIPSCDGDA